MHFDIESLDDSEFMNRIIHHFLVRFPIKAISLRTWSKAFFQCQTKLQNLTWFRVSQMLFRMWTIKAWRRTLHWGLQFLSQISNMLKMFDAIGSFIILKDHCQRCKEKGPKKKRWLEDSRCKLHKLYIKGKEQPLKISLSYVGNRLWKSL